MASNNIGIGMISAFMMVASSVVCAAEEMLPSEYYKTTVLPKASGVYEYQDKLFVHSKVAYESKKPSAKKAAKLGATVGTGKLLRAWAIDLTAPERATKETLSEQDKWIKQLMDGADNYWQFPDWQISARLQCVMDKQLPDEYVIGMVGEKAMLVSMIPAAYKMPCTRERLQNAFPALAKRLMQGESAKGFMKTCGAFDLVSVDGVSDDKISDFKALENDVRQYVETSPLAKELADEAEVLSIPQVVTNKTSVMNEQGTALTEKLEIVTVTRFPRMQKLFLNYSTETNFPTARLASGTAAVASIQNPKITAEERLKLFRQALSDSPGDKELWNFFGRMLLAKGDNLGAVICFRNALKLDDRFIYPIVNLACAYQALGKTKLAVGLAIVGRGLATDGWSVKELDRVLWNGLADSKGSQQPITQQKVQVKSSNQVIEHTKAPDKGVVQNPSATPVKVKAAEPAKPTGAFSSSEVATEIDF